MLSCILEQGLHRGSKCSRNMAGGGEGERKGWMKGVWKSSLGLAVWRVGSPFHGIRSALRLFRETCGVTEGWGEAGLVCEVGFPICQEAPASAFLSHEGFCHLARDGGGSCLPLGLSNGPTTQETVLRRD